jgi:hypothetical protein
MFSRHEAQSAPAERAPSREAPARHEQLSIPRETVEQSAPRATIQNGPENYQPEFGSTVMASTRWTKGRGNVSLLSRLGGTASEALIAPFVAIGRGTIYSLQYAGQFARAGAAFATGIVKDWHWLARPFGLFIVIPSIVIGAGTGFVYGACKGVIGALGDSGRAIASQFSGGGLSYFDFANRAYRD